MTDPKPQDVICIIPARGGSKRLTGKNKRLFAGRPIIEWPILAAQNAGVFTEIIVSSDDAEILSIAHKMGVHAVERPAELCADNVSEIEAYLDVLTFSPCAQFCGLYPTAVFLENELLEAKVKLDSGRYDAVMGVTRFQDAHPYQMLRENIDGYLELEFPKENEYPRYPPAFASNGSFYFFDCESFLKYHSYFPPRLGHLEVFNVDINTAQDFMDAEKLFVRRKYGL